MTPEVLIKPNKDENLHTIMETLEAIVARQRDLNKISESTTSVVGSLQGSLEKLSARCDELDKKLPRGSKIYQAETSTKTQGLYEFGRCITEAWRLKTQGRMSPEFAAEQRAISAGGQTETVDGITGSVLVPVITYNKIARIIGEASVIRKIATIIPMTTNTMNMPTKGTGPTVYWSSTFGEGGIPSKTSVQFNQKQLNTKTMMALDEVTAELDDDSIVALEPFFAQVFAEAVAAEENKQAFVGTAPFTGVTQATGAGVGLVIFGGSTTSGKTSFGSIVHQDIVSLQFGVDSKLINKGVFIMAAGAFANIVGLKDGQGRPIYLSNWNPGVPGMVDGNIPDMLNVTATSLMGRPAYLTDSMPGVSAATTNFAIYGDFSRFAFGDRKQMSIDWSDQVYFESGNLALRVRERIAMQILIPTAFAILRTSTT